MSGQVSLVLPVYNGADYLADALDSVFDQVYQDYELIVVNDGSTDGTSDILACYQREHAFTVIEQENRGLPSALNAGFARAQGVYLTWTSADNLMLPEMLAVLVKALERDLTLGLVYADFYVMDEQGRDLECFATAEFDSHWLLYTNLVHCCFLYRRECMERVGGYNPKFVYSEDWEYWLRISNHYRMKRIPQALYRYRLQHTSMTAEIYKGSALSTDYAVFAAHMRERMCTRWYISRIKRWWARLSGDKHPVIAKRRSWIGITRHDYD